MFPVKTKTQLGIMSQSRDSSKRKPVQKQNSPLFFFLNGLLSQIATKSMSKSRSTPKSGNPCKAEILPNKKSSQSRNLPKEEALTPDT
jgi:hypothetical protein